jgi:hypothetical protein
MNINELNRIQFRNYRNIHHGVYDDNKNLEKSKIFQKYRFATVMTGRKQTQTVLPTVPTSNGFSIDERQTVQKMVFAMERENAIAERDNRTQDYLQPILALKLNMPIKKELIGSVNNVIQKAQIILTGVSNSQVVIELFKLFSDLSYYYNEYVGDIARDNTFKLDFHLKLSYLEKIIYKLKQKYESIQLGDLSANAAQYSESVELPLQNLIDILTTMLSMLKLMIESKNTNDHLGAQEAPFFNRSQIEPIEAQENDNDDKPKTTGTKISSKKPKYDDVDRIKPMSAVEYERMCGQLALYLNKSNAKQKSTAYFDTIARFINPYLIATKSDGSEIHGNQVPVFYMKNAKVLFNNDYQSYQIQIDELDNSDTIPNPLNQTMLDKIDVIKTRTNVGILSFASAEARKECGVIVDMLNHNNMNFSSKPKSKVSSSLRKVLNPIKLLLFSIAADETEVANLTAFRDLLEQTSNDISHDHDALPDGDAGKQDLITKLSIVMSRQQEVEEEIVARQEAIRKDTSNLTDSMTAAQQYFDDNGLDFYTEFDSIQLSVQQKLQEYTNDQIIEPGQQLTNLLNDVDQDRLDRSHIIDEINDEDEDVLRRTATEEEMREFRKMFNVQTPKKKKK